MKRKPQSFRFFSFWPLTALLFFGHLVGMMAIIYVFHLNFTPFFWPTMVLSTGLGMAILMVFVSGHGFLHRWLKLFPPVIYCAFIFLMSNQRFASVSLPVNTDLFHPVEYGVLGILLTWASPHTRFRMSLPGRLLGIFLIGLLYAASDELHQSFVPGRSPSGFDLMLDGLGLLAGIAIGCVISPFQKGGSSAQPPAGQPNRGVSINTGRNIV